MRDASRLTLISAALALSLGTTIMADTGSGQPLAYGMPSPLPTYPAMIYSSKYAIRCVTEEPKRPLSPPIYSYDSIGKLGMPKIDPAYIVILRKIHASVGRNKKDLHFTYSVGNADQDHDFDAFFEAKADVCFDKQMDFLTENPIYKYNVTESSTDAVIDNGDSTPFPWPVSAHPKFRRVGSYGVSCKVPNSDEYAPPSYNAQDIRKPGVPKLHQDEIKTLFNIEKYLPSNEIRFTMLNKSDIVQGMPQGRLVMYQSTADLVCANSYAFPVINQPILSIYNPRSGMYFSQTMSGMGVAPKFPWNHPARPFPIK